MGLFFQFKTKMKTYCSQFKNALCLFYIGVLFLKIHPLHISQKLVPSKDKKTSFVNN